MRRVVRIIGRTTDTGNCFVLKIVAIGIADGLQYLVDKVFLLVCVGSRRFVEVNNLVFISKVRCFYTVDGSDSQSRFVRRRRTYRTRIGVGGKRVVTVLFRTHSSVVVICRRCDQGNTCRLNTVVHLVEMFFILFAGETCRRTQGHIDNVHAQHDAILQARQNPRRFCAVLRVGEYFHNRKLRVRRNARDLIVFTCDNTRNVRTVF